MVLNFIPGQTITGKCHPVTLEGFVEINKDKENEGCFYQTPLNSRYLIFPSKGIKPLEVVSGNPGPAGYTGATLYELVCGLQVVELYCLEGLNTIIEISHKQVLYELKAKDRRYQKALKVWRKDNYRLGIDSSFGGGFSML